jgi:tyrosinase
MTTAARPVPMVEIRHLVHDFRQRQFITHLPPAMRAATLTTRTSEAGLTAVDQQSFINAYSQLINSGFITDCVGIHADMSHMMHGSMGPVGAQRFLPWHRVFLHVFEQHLQAINPALTIPYWDWTTDQQVPDWLQSYTPTVTGATGNTIIVFRTSGADVPFGLPTSADVSTVVGDTDFTTFEQDLENLHNGVHSWVGGPMGDLDTAPADPLFWMHHANIDRIWESWRHTHPGLNPTLSGSDVILDPWSDLEPTTRDTANYNYHYDTLP